MPVDPHAEPLGSPTELSETLAKGGDLEEAANWSVASLSTPRIVALIRLAREEMARQQQMCITDCTALIGELASAKAEQDTLTRDLSTAERALEWARRGPEEEELKVRRRAESNKDERPDSLIRARRLADHTRHLADAQAKYLSLQKRHAEAIQTTEALQEIIEQRKAMARAAARRIHERMSRRIATYLQQLLRTHPHGRYLSRYLSMLLDPVGPDLPEWAQEPTQAESPSLTRLNDRLRKL